jgi:hypothetical protein
MHYNGNAKVLGNVIGTKSEEDKIATQMQARLTVSWIEKAFRAGYAANSMNDQIELDQAWDEFKISASKTISPISSTPNGEDKN